MFHMHTYVICNVSTYLRMYLNLDEFLQASHARSVSATDSWIWSKTHVGLNPTSATNKLREPGYVSCPLCVSSFPYVK